MKKQQNHILINSLTFFVSVGPSYIHDTSIVYLYCHDIVYFHFLYINRCCGQIN